MNGPVGDLELPVVIKPGVCHLCDEWSDHARVIAEVHSDAGAGGTVVRCPSCWLSPKPRRRRASDPRRYPR